MWRKALVITIALTSFVVLPVSYAVERGRGGGGSSEGRQSPGGSWSERLHQGGSGHHSYGQSGSEQDRGGQSSRTNDASGRSPEGSANRESSDSARDSNRRTTSDSNSSDASAGAAAKKHNQPNPSNDQAAAAGAAASNRNSPQYSGAEGAAAANRNQPTYSGAQGAAAGAAASNRNSSQYSGKQGAAAGAAVANRNQPQYSGAQGAAAGVAAANRNQPAYSGAQGAAIGAAAANQNAPTLSGAQGAAVGAASANQNQPTITGAQGAAIGGATANQSAPAVSRAPGTAAGAAATNQNGPTGSGLAGGAADNVTARTTFKNYKLFTQEWNSQNPDAWRVSRWVAGNAWSPTSSRAVSGFYGSAAAPNWYDYGENVVYKNGDIIMNGQDVGTAEQFSQQAADLAQVGAENEPTDSTWLPLGVFAMVRNEQEHPHLIMQLAVNRQGMLRGNYTDEVTENTQPIRGAVDQNAQRAAWIVGNHQSLVMEAGLSNLSEGDAPALIHKNGKTDHWLLVRLKQPEGGASATDVPRVPQ